MKLIEEKPRVLVVEDDEDVRTQMKWALAQDYEVHFAMDPENAMKILESVRPPLVTLDLGLPPKPEDTTEGLRLLERILQFEPLTKVVVVSGNPDNTSALNAISLGAQDFFSKPINTEEVKAVLKRAYYVHHLEAEYRRLQQNLKQQSFGEMVGSGPRMQEIFTKVRKLSNSDVPVLITGESGTGKELVATAIHRNSNRKDKPFVPINCGAIPENLLESELFGHEKGAFTGAHVQRKGRIEIANGGTLFLDEIGELPLFLQVKLLRFLQDHKIERVGGRETREMDTRVVAATNRDLKKLVSEGKFREDLYYRLAVVTIELPPLRERGNDIILLAKSFLQKYSATSPMSLSQEAIKALTEHLWPGNVRELENKIRHAVTFVDSNVIYPSDLELGQSSEGPQSLSLKEAKRELEIKLIQMALAKHEGNVSKAADELGLTRPTLYNLMKKINLIRD